MKMLCQPKAIDKIYKRRDRIEMPEFQRGKVWPDDKKRLLIDTILKGWHLPKFYFRKLDNGTFECVDGQQRLDAIWLFFGDNLTLSPEMAHQLSATVYSELPDDVSDKFDDYLIDVEEIEDASDEELEELFQRLQLGVNLNSAEKLNAIGGKMREFCKRDVAPSRFFTEKIKLADTRYAHYLIAVQWLFVESHGIPRRMRFPDLETFLKDQRSFSKQSETAKRVLATLDYLDNAFPTRSNLLRNKANTLSVCMLASRVLFQDIDPGTAPIFGRFINDFFAELSEEVEKGSKSKEKELLAYQRAVSAATAEGVSVGTRIDILTKRLVAYSHEFSPLLGAYQGASKGANKSIAEIADSVIELVHNVNRKYSAVCGPDLFTLTNETSAGMHNMRRPCADASKLASFIDCLYFLVYEGSGSGNRLPKSGSKGEPPQFSMDIKFLRNQLRHDLAHGSESEIKKKRTRGGAVFKKYSGKDSLAECNSHELIATQLRLLSKMKDFLRDLLQTQGWPEPATEPKH